MQWSSPRKLEVKDRLNPVERKVKVIEEKIDGMDVFNRVVLRGQLREFKRRKAVFEGGIIREEGLFKDLFAQMHATPIVGPPPMPKILPGPSDTALLSSQRDALVSSAMYFDSRSKTPRHPSSHVPPSYPAYSPHPAGTPQKTYFETWKERDERYVKERGKMEYVTGGMAQIGYTYKKDSRTPFIVHSSLPGAHTRGYVPKSKQRSSTHLPFPMW